MKLFDYEFTTIADNELNDIQDKLADLYPYRDIRFTDQLGKIIDQVRTFPEIGRLVPKRPNLRFVIVWDFLVFYSAYPNLIRIERVIHGARDIDALLE